MIRNKRLLSQSCSDDETTDIQRKPKKKTVTTDSGHSQTVQNTSLNAENKKIGEKQDNKLKEKVNQNSQDIQMLKMQCLHQKLKQNLQSDEKDDLFEELLNEDSEEDSEKETSQQCEIIQKIKDFLQERKAVLVGNDIDQMKNQTVVTQNTLFTVKCFQNHIWDSSFKIFKSSWCPKCENQFQKVTKYIQKFHGKILSPCLLDELEIQCANNHNFSIQLKNYQENRCQQCYDKILMELTTKECDKNYIIDSVKEKGIRMAQQFIQNHLDQYSFEQDFDKFSCLFFILEINQNIYREYLQLLPKESLKVLKLKIYKNIHPDVNRHPTARQAFTKFTSIVRGF